MKPCRLAACAAGAALALLAGAGQAQESYPSKVIRIIAPATGGGSDVVGRMIAPGLSTHLGQQVIIDNRGAVASEIVAKSPPDGYTLLVNGSPGWLLPVIRPNSSWDAMRDFAPITIAVNSPSMLVTHPSVPAKSAKDLITLAKKNPGKLNYAAGTLGAAPHLAGELFRSMADIKVVRVPYKGSGPGLLGVMTGEVEFMFPGAASAWGYVKQGKLKGLGICSAQRSALFPGVPTVAESGLPGYESISPQALMAPAKTPAAIVNRLHQEIVRVLNAPDIKERFASGGMEVVGNTPEQAVQAMKADIARVSKLVKEAGIQSE
jgi:tripartite-type tricarboxylate transporter receptor subunit TctC